MKIYTCNNFTGHWPVGTAAVVVAANPIEASILLNKELVKGRLDGDATPDDMWELSADTEKVRILCNGDY